MNTSRSPLGQTLLEIFRQGPAGPLDDDRFNALALQAFRHQFERNEPYRRFCERRGIVPERVERWEDVPAVPTAAFKEAALVCGPGDAAQAVFRTSGTTQGSERRGTHYVLDLALYRESALSAFRAHLLPDGARLPFLILAPSPERAPDSSLSRMFEWVRAECGAPGSGWFVSFLAGLHVDELVQALGRSESERVPALIAGTAFAFVYLFDALAARSLRFRLPEGSRVMETGGLKGRVREITKAELYEGFAQVLGIPDHFCVGEYGMTEMCSQFYEDVLRARAPGLETGPGGPRRMCPPRWVRTLVVDPDTLRPLPQQRPGLLRHFDLANLNSVSALQTDDLGLGVAAGFQVLGRARGAEARGCSIALDEWLTATR
ncbi:MAG: long-chain fatty acid--CoA ligase [Gemmatimonadetes bacterium]|nr:long-chain fatty acid--CoA ligase [Gemmatimonadota bacterium]